MDRQICDRSVDAIIKKRLVKAKCCEQPSELEDSEHSLRVRAAQHFLNKGYGLAAIMRAGGWSKAKIVSRYLQFSPHSIRN